MRILIVTRGTLGDVQPFVALGKCLKASGHTVSVCTHTNFKGVIEFHGLHYSHMGDGLTRFIESQSGREITENLKSKRGFLRHSYHLIKQLRPIRRQMLNDSWMAAENTGPDLLLFHPQAFWVPDFAEKLGIPVVMGTITPSSVPTGEYPHLFFPGWNLGRGYNRLTYRMATKLFAAEKRKSVHEWRETHLPPCNHHRAHLPDAGLGHRIPVLHAHSPSVVPAPADWPKRAYITGYWLLDQQEAWQPPPGLVSFLERGEPPVYIGFGSMAGSNPKRLLSAVLKALERADARGLIVAGGGSLPIEGLPDRVFGIDHVPHQWLFPRVAAAVHHGGSGTTAASLRAGCPTIVCPLQGDQPFWGERVRSLGVGSRPIPQRKMTAEALGSAIQEVTTNRDLRCRAADLGEKIRQEDGVGTALGLIEKIVAG